MCSRGPKGCRRKRWKKWSQRLASFLRLFTIPQYLDKFRNLEFLENELEQYYQAEQEKMEAQDRRLKKMQKRLA